MSASPRSSGSTEGKLCIISGAAGFLGSTIIRQLGGRAPMRALSLPGENRIALRGLQCEVVDADVTRPESLQAAFSGAERFPKVLIIHCAGIIDIRSKPNPNVERVNVGGTHNMVQAARNLSAESGTDVRFVYVGSVHAIPPGPQGSVIRETEDFDPDRVEGQYAKSKAAASRAVMEAATAGLDALVVEPSGIIGPDDYSPENMKRLILLTAEGRMRMSVRGGYNFVDVRDVAAGVIQAAEKGKAGRSYILAGHSVPIQGLMDEVCAISGRRPIRALIPLWLAKAAAPICERYYKVRKKVPLFTSYALSTLQDNSSFSCGRAQEELGYTVRPLVETLKDTVDWMESQPDWDPRR